MGTVILANDNTRTGGKTAEKANQHIDDGTNGADCGEGLVADVVANDPGVHCVIKLLENVADEQGECKIDNMPGNTALGHVHILAFFGHQELGQTERKTLG